MFQTDLNQLDSWGVVWRGAALSSVEFLARSNDSVKSFGGGASPAMMGVAKQPSAGGSNAPPSRIIAMASDCVNSSARSQPAAAHRSGAVEHWHCAGAELRPHHCRRHAGLLARYQRTQRAR